MSLTPLNVVLSSRTHYIPHVVLLLFRHAFPVFYASVCSSHLNHLLLVPECSWQMAWLWLIYPFHCVQGSYDLISHSEVTHHLQVSQSVQELQLNTFKKSEWCFSMQNSLP